MSPEEIAKKAEWRKRASLGLKPCPFCGKRPVLVPTRPEIDGDAWAAVCCVNKRCAVAPNARDGSNCASHRINYYAMAAKRWNRRAATGATE